MKIYLRFCMALLIVALLGGCTQTYSENDLARAREEAYSNGYQAGLSEAAGQILETDRYQEGFDAGRSEGYGEGYALGLEEGGQAFLSSVGDSYQQGYDEGYASGYANQRQESQAARQQYVAAIQSVKPSSQQSHESTTVNSESQTAGLSENQESSGQTVYVTKSGSKYHQSSCSHLSKSKIEKSLAEAKVAGYTPCGSCKPPQ